MTVAERQLPLFAEPRPKPRKVCRRKPKAPTSQDKKRLARQAAIRNRRRINHREQLRKPAVLVARKPTGNWRDISGQRFGSLVAVDVAGFLGTQLAWNCDCDCGRRCVVRGPSLRNGTTKTCGCSRGECHQMAHLREYRIWAAMKNRCHNPKTPRFSDYGGRGIAVCEEWRNSFKAFYEYIGPAPSRKHTIDRYPNNDGNYEPGNVRWATVSEQANNTSQNLRLTADGRTQTLSQWAREAGTNASVMLWRLKRYPQEMALLTPVGQLDPKYRNDDSHMASRAFQVGDAVTWSSTSRGKTAMKCGTVFAVIEAGFEPRSLASKFDDLNWWNIIAGVSRNCVSYLVTVPAKSARGLTRVYWPKASKLLPQSSETRKAAKR